MKNRIYLLASVMVMLGICAASMCMAGVPEDLQAFKGRVERVAQKLGASPEVVNRIRLTWGGEALGSYDGVLMSVNWKLTMKYNDGELAFVIGHEMTHARNRDVQNLRSYAQRRSDQLNMSDKGEGYSKRLKEFRTSVGDFISLIEFNADRGAVELMKSNGFDLRDATGVIKRIYPFIWSRPARQAVGEKDSALLKLIKVSYRYPSRRDRLNLVH